MTILKFLKTYFIHVYGCLPGCMYMYHVHAWLVEAGEGEEEGEASS